MRLRVVAIAFAVLTFTCASPRPMQPSAPVPASTEARTFKPEERKQLPQAIAPKAFPRVPPPSADAAQVPDGYRAELVVSDLQYPTSVEFDGEGNLYVAEAGFAYGDPVAPARVLRITPKGEFAIYVDQLSGPVTDLLWHEGRLYVSHWGRVSVVESPGRVRDLVTDLPVSWDHQNNQLAAGPDGKLYFGLGTVTNAGIVGLDNVSPFLWLLFWPDLHDVPAADLELEDVSYTTPDPLTVLANQGELVSFAQAAKHLVSGSEPLLVRTGAFQPFGQAASKVKGQVKANGTVLRMNLDGSGLEQFAWGLRNPFGLAWGPDGQLYATDNGYDERGSRPIANAPDAIWRVRQGGFYGFPDYVAGIPVTDPRFRSSRGPEPKRLLKKTPPVEKPLATRPPHAGTTKIDFSRSAAFGFEGQMFFGEVGSGTPINAPQIVLNGYQVTRFDPKTGEATPMLRAKESALGPKGYEYVATAAPKRPVDVRFSPDGAALYVADFGALAAFPAGAGPLGRPFPGSGAVWRIVKDGASHVGPPANLAPMARVR